MSPASSSWRTASASVMGASHRAADVPCQDAHLVKSITSPSGAPHLIVVAADGAGSAAHGATGAKVTCATLLEQVEIWIGAGHDIAKLDRGSARDWLTAVRESIASEAAESSEEMRAYACTLLFAIIGADAAAFGQIGDGAIVVSDREREWSWVFWPQRGPYANTTFFVTDDKAFEQLEVSAGRRSIDELAMFTDGIEPLVLDYQARTPHAPFFERMLTPLRASPAIGADPALCAALDTYLGSSVITERTDDDTTLILASRRTVGIGTAGAAVVAAAAASAGAD